MRIMAELDVELRTNVHPGGCECECDGSRLRWRASIAPVGSTLIYGWGGTPWLALARMLRRWVSQTVRVPDPPLCGNYDFSESSVA